MNITSWIERKERLQGKYGSGKDNGRKHDRSPRHVIAGIKRALTENRLSKIKIAVGHLHNNPDQVPEVIGQLNTSIGHRSLLFQWFPGYHNESSALLIRNESTGLLIKTDPNSMPKGMRMTPNAPAPFCSLAPEHALSVLSSQACLQAALPNHALERIPRLQLLLSTFENASQNN